MYRIIASPTHTKPTESESTFLIRFPCVYTHIKAWISLPHHIWGWTPGSGSQMSQLQITSKLCPKLLFTSQNTIQKSPSLWKCVLPLPPVPSRLLLCIWCSPVNIYCILIFTFYCNSVSFSYSTKIRILCVLSALSLVHANARETLSKWMSKYFKEEIQLSVEFVNHHTVFMAPEIYGWSLRREKRAM